tara:strand:- start:1317 stop:3284 length:1968 start_codon:yes stop_codon:yes gene_type:complete
MDEENKKIDIESFFGRLDSIEAVANDAILKSESNLGIINELGSIITNISTALESLQTEVQEINNYIVIQKDAEEDRRFEEEDARQKREMSDRTSGLQGKGTGVAAGATAGAAAGASTEGNEFGKDPVKRTLNPFKQIGNLFNLGGALLTSGVGTLGSGIGALTSGVLGFSDGGQITPKTGEKVKGAEPDTQLIAAQPGEFVVTKDAVEKIGVDTLKGINAAAGGTNKPKPLGPLDTKSGFLGNLFGGTNKSKDIKVFEEGKKDKDYSKRTTDMSGGGIDEETITRETITENGSVVTTEERMRERIVSIGVPDLIEHKTQLLGEIHKLKGFEKVTIDDVINRTTGIPQDKLIDILNKSDAAKATEKKQEDAINEDYKARNIKPGKRFSMSYDDEVAKSLQGTIGYRIGQINPDQLVMSIDEITEKSTLTTKETFKSAKDPKFKKAHANAKKSGGVKGFNEGGLVGGDIKGKPMNILSGGDIKGKPMNILSGITKSLEDLTKSPLAKEMKNMADNDTLGLKDIANEASEIMGGEEGLGVFKDNIMNIVKERLLGGEESSNLLQKIESSFDNVSKLAPTDNEMIQTNNSQSVQSPSSGNKGVSAQRDLANVSEVELRQTTSNIPFVNLQRLQSAKFNNITHVNESDLPVSIRNLLKIK